MTLPEPFLDRRALTRAFDRAATGYDSAASLQQRVGRELLQRLDYFALTPRWIVDLGAGTCQADAPLRQRYRSAQVLSLDLAEGMLRAAPRPRWPRRAPLRVCADAAALPLADDSVDLVVSNLMLQWCDPPQSVFSEVARVLRPKGLFLFTSFGPQTLQELRAAWRSADAGEHVSPFLDMPELGAALMHSGLAEPVLDIESIALFYPDALALMRALKQIGATNAAANRRRGLTGRALLQQVSASYEQLRERRGLPATYEVIFGAAFATADEPTGQAELRSGEHLVPLSSLRRRS